MSVYYGLNKISGKADTLIDDVAISDSRDHAPSSRLVKNEFTTVQSKLDQIANMIAALITKLATIV